MENVEGSCSAELAKEDAQSEDGTLEIWSLFRVGERNISRPSLKRQQQCMTHRTGSGRLPGSRFVGGYEAYLDSHHQRFPAPDVHQEDQDNDGGQLDHCDGNEASCGK